MLKRRLTQAVLSVGVAGGLLLGTAAAASACDLCWDEPEPPARGECSGGLCGTPSQTGGGGPVGGGIF
jgi:cyclic lactone autoinducer peptide